MPEAPMPGGPCPAASHGDCSSTAATTTTSTAVRSALVASRRRSPARARPTGPAWQDPLGRRADLHLAPPVQRLGPATRYEPTSYSVYSNLGGEGQCAAGRCGRRSGRSGWPGGGDAAVSLPRSVRAVPAHGQAERGAGGQAAAEVAADRAVDELQHDGGAPAGRAREVREG